MLKPAIVIAVAFAANAALLLLVAVPTIVTWAEVPPKSIHCALCETDEVRGALAQAASDGRMQVIRMERSTLWPVLGLCVLNIGIVIICSMRARRSLNPSGKT